MGAWMLRKRLTGAAAALFLITATPALATIEIQWWHAMPGELGREVDRLAADFNASQIDFRVVPIYKGLYTETMTAALFAVRSRQHPAIVQAAEVATATMMAAKDSIYPVFELMRNERVIFDRNAYLPAVTSYYSDV